VSKRQKRDRIATMRRHGRRIRPEDLHPKQAEGLTVGMSAKDALKAIKNPHEHVDGESLVQHQMGGEQEKIGRVPVWRAVLRDDTHSVWKENDGRLQRNVIESIDVETLRALRAGHICLRCHEPHPEAFPEMCDLCGYPMAERQIMDIAMEFRGHEHIGPGLPIADYLEEQERRLERRERKEARRSGKSPMHGLRQKILSPGAKRERGVKDGDVRAT
jgi:hypothetical protein